MRPWSIILYERLFAASIALGALTSLLAWPLMRASVAAATAQSGLPMNAMLTVLLASVGAGAAISLLLLFFTARRGSAIARIVTGAWFLFGLISGVRGLVLAMLPWPFLLSGAVQVLLQLVMLYLLFGPEESKLWFRSRGGRR